MQTTVKKWFKDKNFGFLANGTASDIMVRQADLVKCQYLKVGATVEFECHADKKGLVAKKVRLVNQQNKNTNNNQGHKQGHNQGHKRGHNQGHKQEPYIGVMT